MTTNQETPTSSKTIAKDLLAGLIVFLVALPLCLGIALASSAPLFSGLIAGILGGIVVGFLSGSHTSVSGPAAGLTAIVASQIEGLGSFNAFLLAVVVGGVMQVGLGVIKAGALSAFFPSSVIKGLLAAIGVILILKQLPHLLGHDNDPLGEMSFQQPNDYNTFTELWAVFSGDIQFGAMVIGLASLVFLIAWDLIKPLKNSLVPAPLVVVLMGIGLAKIFEQLGTPWHVDPSHMVQVPVAETFAQFADLLQFPDFSMLTRPAIYLSGATIAVVASLETLLNLDAVDKLDKKQRISNPSRELIAQGVGNISSGLIGGLPVTAVIVRGSVNIMAGAETKLSSIFHGFLLLISIAFLPTYLNTIPLSALAAILILTGYKLASPALFKTMWKQGKYQFAPFILTLVAIVMTDLVVGVLMGLVISLLFILNSNLRRPIYRTLEKHIGGDVLHIELANQVSFLNRAALEAALREAPRGSQILLNAKNTDYIDPDILGFIREFKDVTAPVYDLQVSLVGFREKYQLKDEIQYVDYLTRELQEKLTPQQVLQIMVDGNLRFRTSKNLTRNLSRQLNVTSKSQHPLAVVLSCIDSRTPVELIFDLGLGDVFSVRVAGNVVSKNVLGSIEYGSAVAGAKVVLVMGHTSCGAVSAAISLANSEQSIEEATGCQNLSEIIHAIQTSSASMPLQAEGLTVDGKQSHANEVAIRNVKHVVDSLLDQSSTLRKLVSENRIVVVGCMYDINTGQISLVEDAVAGIGKDDLHALNIGPEAGVHEAEGRGAIAVIAATGLSHGEQARSPAEK